MNRLRNQTTRPPKRTDVAGNWLIAVGAVIIFGALLHGCDSSPSAAPSGPNVEYQTKMADLCHKLSSKGVNATWPSNGNDYVMRADLPGTWNGATVDWDEHSERKTALDIYNAFVGVRQEAGVSDPQNCIVHVFDDTGKQVAHADESGASN